MVAFLFRRRPRPRPRKPSVHLQHIDNYFHVQQWWNRLVGIAQIQTGWRRALFDVYRIFVLLLMAHITLLLTVTVCIDIRSGSLEAVSYSLPQMVIMTISLFYLVYFQANGPRYFALMAHMNGGFRFRSARGLTYVTVQRSYELCKMAAALFPLLALGSCAIVSALPLFQSTKRTLPLNVWHPFDATRTPYYQLLYVAQVLVQVAMPLSFCASMAVPLSMAVLLCAQYDVLCCDLKNLPWTALRLAAPGRRAVEQMRGMQKSLALNVTFEYCTEYLDEIDNNEQRRKCPKKMYDSNDTSLDATVDTNYFALSQHRPA